MYLNWIFSPCSDRYFENDILLFVFQLTPIGLTIYQQITATDADQLNNGQITYSLVTGDGSIVSTYSYKIVLVVYLQLFLHINTTTSLFIEYLWNLKLSS